GAKYDLVKHPHGTVVFEAAGKSEFIQIGELIQVGSAWRLVDAPTPGASADLEAPEGSTRVANNPELQKLLEELGKIDKTPPTPQATPGPQPAIVQYNLQRADLLEKIIGKVDAKERETWIRQVADSLSTAAQSSPATDKTAYERLLRLEEQIVKGMAPGHG